MAALLPLLKDNAKLIVALDAVIGIGMLIFKVGVGFLVWLSRRDARAKERPETEVLRRVTLEKLRFYPGSQSRRMKRVDLERCGWRSGKGIGADAVSRGIYVKLSTNMAI